MLEKNIMLILCIKQIDAECIMHLCSLVLSCICLVPGVWLLRVGATESHRVDASMDHVAT